MFLLNKNNVESDQFGWWLTGSRPEDRDEEESSKNLEEMNCDGRDDFLKNVDYQTEEEINEGEEPECKTSSRSYTPERLIRNQDYSILTISPNYLLKNEDEDENDDDDDDSDSTSNFKLNLTKKSNVKYLLKNLIDKETTGASHLEEIFEPSINEFKDYVKITRFLNKSLTKIDKDFNKTITKKKTENDNNLFNFLLEKCNQSPRKYLTPDLISSRSSSCSEILNNCDCFVKKNEFLEDFQNYFKYDDDNLIIEDEQIYEDLSKSSDSDEDLNNEKKTDTKEDPRIVVQNLKIKIQRIKDTNKNIFRQVLTLKNKFQLEEKKTGNLSNETTRLRREIRDLRYIDDLVNLLRGEIQRISQRNWPFNIGHLDNNSEEINLVV